MSDSLSVKLVGTNALLSRLTRLQQQYSPENPAVQVALKKAAMLIIAQAKLNLRSRGMVDSGRLINSLRFEFFKPENLDPEGGGTGIRVGSFGVPYAAIHEFGGTFTPAMKRAMFASLAARGKLGQPYTPKGVVQNGVFIARPYMRTAYETHKQAIIDMINKAYQEG